MPKLSLAAAITGTMLLGCGEAATAPQASMPASTASFSQAVVGGATGGYTWTIPLPNEFGVEVWNRALTFTAMRHLDGSVNGRFEYHQVVLGEAFIFNGEVTCLGLYDGNRAKVGGVIVNSNDPTLPAGVYLWFQAFDNGEGSGAVPDQSTLIGVGDEAENEAFCASPALPRFGPWDVQGNIQVSY